MCSISRADTIERKKNHASDSLVIHDFPSLRSTLVHASAPATDPETDGWSDEVGARSACLFSDMHHLGLDPACPPPPVPRRAGTGPHPSPRDE